MSTLVGRVGIVMTGGYNSAATYHMLDAVSYNNALYIAKQDVPTGTAPTNTTYWQSAIDASNIKPTVHIYEAAAEVASIDAGAIKEFTISIPFVHGDAPVGITRIVPGNTGLTIASYRTTGSSVVVNVLNTRDTARNGAPEVTVVAILGNIE